MRGALVAVAFLGALGCSSTGGDTPAAKGQDSATRSGCTSCHGADGSGGVGPAWRGLAGSKVRLADGSTVTADDTYLRRAIRDPKAQVVRGYNAVMPTVRLSDQEIDDLIAYIHSLGGTSG